MSELVMMQHGEPVTTSLSIAEGVEIAHKSVIQLVRKYADDLQEFGPCAFEMRMVNREQGGGKPVEYAILNEPQSTLLLTYMRNSEIVRQFKKSLVRAFFELRNQQQPSETLPASPQHLADHIVAAGRVFNMLVKAGRTMGLSRADAVARANNAAIETGGVDLVQLMGADDVVRPTLECKAKINNFAEQLTAWLEQHRGTEYTSEQLMTDALGIKDPENGDYIALASVMQSLGWRRMRVRVNGTQRWGYRKPAAY